MILWRISNHVDLTGRGGLRAGGRWHLAGRPVVYLAESPSGALLEVYTQTASTDAPPTLKLLKIVGPELAADEVPVTSLPDGWEGKVALTRKLGAVWLERGKSALLRVPSAVAPETANYLFNPLHPRAELFRVERSFKCPFEVRLLA